MRTPPSTPRTSSRVGKRVHQSFELVITQKRARIDSAPTHTHATRRTGKIAPTPVEEEEKENEPVFEEYESEEEQEEEDEEEVEVVNGDGVEVMAEEENSSTPSPTFDDRASPVPSTSASLKEEYESEADASHYPTPLTTPTKPLPLYSRAKSLLSTSHSLPPGTPFVARPEETYLVRSFLRRRFAEIYADEEEQEEAKEDGEGRDGEKVREGGSLYISGLPGLGKTALLDYVLADFRTRLPPKSSISIFSENCSTIPSSDISAGEKSTSNFWERLGKGLGMKQVQGLDMFEKRLKEMGKKGRKCLLVLDEIDALLPHSSSTTSNATSAASSSKSATAKPSFLQTLFLLSSQPDSPLTLIGIANSLDLTSRHLSHFPAAQLPRLLHFQPYKAKDIIAIVKQRLNLLSFEAQEGEKLMDEKALMLFARRIENVEGDLRLAFGLARKAIGVVEKRVRERFLVASLSVTPSPSSSDALPADDSSGSTPVTVDHLMSALTVSTADKVLIPDILATFRSAGFLQNDPLANQIASLSLNPRLVLVAILIALSKASPATSTSPSGKKKLGSGYGGLEERKEVTSSEAFTVYREVLKIESGASSSGGGLGLRILNQSEFSSTLDVLASHALISVYAPSSNSPSKKKSLGTISNPSISLPLSASSTTKTDLIEALKTVPGSSDEGSSSVGVELMRISKNLFGNEERKVGRVLKSLERERERQEVMKMVPRGWERDGEDWLGKKAR